MSGNTGQTYDELYAMAVVMVDSRFDAGQLFTHVTQKKVYHLPFIGSKQATQKQEQYLRSVCEQRRAGVPLQYILGEWEFYGLPFKVGKGVLIPRAETELLVDTAIKIAKDYEKPEILDLCSGTGCIAIALAEHISKAVVTAVEFSEQAYAYMLDNKKLNFSRVITIQADANTYCHTAKIDILVCNPPYIPAETISTLQPEVRYEPRLALGGGKDGLTFYRAITKNYRDQLGESGWICFEVGKGQSEQVASIFEENGYIDIQIKNDLADIPRVVYARK